MHTNQILNIHANVQIQASQKDVVHFITITCVKKKKYTQCSL